MIDEVMMLRHGRTQYNLEHRLQGQIDVPLDIVGQWQVDQTGFALASRYYWAKVNRLAEHPEAIAQPGPDAAERTDTRQFEEAPAAGRRMVVMTSDLFRAQQTAHAFADILGLPVTCDQRLRERSFGEWEGMTRAEIKAVAADDYASWKQHTGGETKHGVESRAAVGQRGADAVRALVIDSAYSDSTPTTLMLVTHGSWITATISNLLELGPGRHERTRRACATPVGAGSKCATASTAPPPNSPLWELEEYNKAPAIADSADWENGPTESCEDRTCQVGSQSSGDRSSMRNPARKFERWVLRLISVWNRTAIEQ